MFNKRHASVECLQDLIIVQDYCDGGDLAHYIFFKKKSNELVPETNIIQWLLGVPATYSLDIAWTLFPASS